MITESMFKNKILTITGGTGSFGKKMIEHLADHSTFKELQILSRDEMKQWHLQEKYKNVKKNKIYNRRC